MHAINVSAPKARLADESNLEEQLNKLIRAQDVVLMQGAGTIGQIASNLMHVAREIA